MLFILLLGVFGGIKLDKLVKLEFPLFTILFSFLAMVLALYYAVKDLLHKNKP
ncbi:MAG: AtpZ/AtpI family protein [Bacteroidales bacterium]|nr:AtpZ/AtpI family protein [Bacteroidales bacterium]